MPPSRAVVASTPKEIQTEIDSLLQIGEATYRDQPDSGVFYFNRALIAARQSEDSQRIALALTGAGQAERRRHNLAAARSMGEHALMIKLRLHMKAELFRSYNALGLVAWNEERLNNAQEWFASAIDAARQNGDTLGIGKASINLGNVSRDRGQFQEARRAYELGRDIARSAGDTLTLAEAVNDIAALDIDLGNPKSAIEGLEMARALALAVNSVAINANALGQLALAYNALGEPQRAFTLLDSAIYLARQAGLEQEARANIKLRGDLFADAGDFQHALDEYSRTASLIDSIGTPDEYADILLSEARAHAALGNTALAATRASLARKLHRRASLPFKEFVDLLVQASIAMQSGQASVAEVFLAAARNISVTLGAPSADVAIGLLQAELDASRGRWTEVVRITDRLRTLLPTAGANTEALALDLRARAFDHIGHLNDAITSGEDALQAVERVRGNYATGALRTSYSFDKRTVYASQVMRLLRAGRSDAALAVADAARGRSLVEFLGASGDEVDSAGYGAQLRTQDQLLRRIDRLTAQLQEKEFVPPAERATAFDAVSSELRNSILAARSEYEALVARGGTQRNLPLSVSAPVRITLAQIQKRLAPREALIEYLVTPERLLIFVVTAAGVTTHQVNESATSLSGRVQLVRELLERRDQDPFAINVLRALHGLLLAPVRNSGVLRDVDQLIIVPHGALVYLPFSALVDARSGKFLMQDFSLLHASNSASIAALRSSIVATPLTPAHAEVFAPLPDQLPATRGEALSVSRSVPASTVQIGAGATEEKFRNALQSDAIVHVATHARLNSRNPLFSGLHFAAGRGKSLSDDGKLEVHELFGMHVRSRLVFLSGCETGLGGSWSTRFGQGEDYASLSQMLLYAGARNVISTLWRIDDAGASEFARRFYDAMRHTSETDALARAQRETIAVPRFRSPYYWAAFELTGAGVLDASGGSGR